MMKGDLKTKRKIKTVERTFVGIVITEITLHCFIGQIKFLNNSQENGIRKNMLNEFYLGTTMFNWWSQT